GSSCQWEQILEVGYSVGTRPRWWDWLLGYRDLELDIVVGGVAPGHEPPGQHVLLVPDDDEDGIPGLPGLHGPQQFGGEAIGQGLPALRTERLARGGDLTYGGSQAVHGLAECCAVLLTRRLHGVVLGLASF